MGSERSWRLRLCDANRATRLVVVAMCSVIVGSTAQGPLEIDFRTARTTRPDLVFVGGSGTGGGIGGTGAVTTPPLTVKLVHPESAACNSAPRYATVELLNTSPDAMLLPWDPDGAQLVAAKSGEQRLEFETLTLTLRSRSQPQIFMTRELYERASVPASRVTLASGESVLLRGILLPRTEGILCGQDLLAEVALSSDQAVRSGKGYVLNSKERLRVRSR